jgi:DAK2 domain fusion protein YloV
VLDTLDAASVRAWAEAAATALEARRMEIDDLNVFPIADSDTGTNLAETMRAAADAIATEAEAATTSAASALGSLARAAVLGARGNSGVIVAQLLRGLADGINGAPSCDATLLRRALDRAAASAYAAVGQPTEGTILSVARAAAMATRQLAPTAQLAEVVCAARDGAIVALARTPQQLPVLAHAGVVDAGGRGLVVLLDALCQVITGDPSVLRTERRDPNRAQPVLARPAVNAPRETGSDAYEYEVQYLLDASEVAVEELRAMLGRLGDSLTVVGTGTGVWNVHVHVNDVGAALEAAVVAGRPHRISVTRFADKLAAPDPLVDSRGTVLGPTAVIVLLADGGLVSLFEHAGVTPIVVTEHTDGEHQVLATINAAGGSRVVLLPTDPELAAVAGALARPAREAGVDVVVVPTRSPMQGLAAVAVHDDSRRTEDDVIAMAEAAAATRYASVEIATGAGLTTIGACSAGDVLGLIEGDVVEIGRASTDIAVSMLRRLIGVGGELISVILGPTAPAGTDVALRACVAAQAPLAELVIYPSEQLDAVVLLAME